MEDAKKTEDTNRGKPICRAECSLKKSQIKLLRQAALPAGDIFLATVRLNK